MNDVRIQIVKLMRLVASPISAYAISKNTGLHVNLVHYHLKKMESEGIVIRTKEGYGLIPVLYDEALIAGMEASLLPFVRDMAKALRPCKPELVMRSLEASLSLLLEEIRDKGFLTKES